MSCFSALPEDSLLLNVSHSWQVLQHIVRSIRAKPRFDPANKVVWRNEFQDEQSGSANHKWFSWWQIVLVTCPQQYASILLMLKAVDSRAFTTEPVVLNGMRICRPAILSWRFAEAEELPFAVLKLDPA